MNKIFKQISLIFLLVFILIFPYFVFAGAQQSITDNMQEAAGGYNTSINAEVALPQTLGMIVNVALSLLGVVFIVLIIYAGYNWMTARGDEGKIETAKDTILRAIIGLIIVVGSYAIWYFIADKLF